MNETMGGRSSSHFAATSSSALMKPAAAALLLLVLLSSLCNPSAGVDHCDPSSLPDPLTLRSDQLTVLISGYSERRLPLLRSLAASYAAHPSVSAVLILWGNPSTPPSLLDAALRFPSAAISVLRDPSSRSLNSRFLPRAAIRTRAVAVCDDDVEVDPDSLSHAFNVWRGSGGGEDRLVGFFARSHEYDLGGRRWMYSVHPERYSIVLTKFMVLKTEYLASYTCGGGGGRAAARRFVDGARNCEDILMNFVAAEESGMGPVLVEGGRRRRRRGVRDWGDPRNSVNGSEEEEVMKVAGLSSIGEHRKRRGECITEFHRLLGRMPLRYSYGKVVEGVGEQALCNKGGKLVFCDDQQHTNNNNKG